MTALVTGGSGFIGHHLVAALAARGEAVRVLDRRALPAAPAGVEFVEGSVLDRNVVRQALDGVDCVYHLAAIAHLWTPDAHDYARVNRGGTEIVLAAARERNVPRFVHCSTETTLFARRPMGTIDESSSAGLSDMAGPYARSKYRAEEAAVAAASDGLSVVVVNPTCPIGPGDRTLTPPMAMLRHFLEGSSPFFLDCVLNIVDVRDVATGMMLAAERGRLGERYILGGDNVRLGRLAEMLDEMSGRHRRKLPIPGLVALAAGYVGEAVASHVTGKPPMATAEGVELALRAAPLNVDKARRELGYAPRPLGEALAGAVSWLRAQHPSGVRRTSGAAIGALKSRE